MALENTWVGYIDRSYQQIKQSLLTRLQTSNPEITDHSESNILVIIISMFSGVIEMLGYYVDNMAREAFIATARKFTSMVKLVKILDYRIKAAYPSSADVTFSFNTALTGPGIIPVGTKVKTSNNIEFLTIESLNLLTGATSGTIGVKQVTQLTNQNIGTTNGTPNQAFSLGVSYVDSSVEIEINSIPWTLVNTLGLSGPNDKHFIVEIDTDGLAYVVFGNGTNGEIPPTAQNVIADYQETLGVLGNVDANTIKTIVPVLSLPGVTTITVNNPIASSGGSNYEDIEKIRINAPLSIRTLERAVTVQDYRDLARLAPGVGKADVYFNCGKTVDIYIVPAGGGIAQSSLLNSTKIFLDQRKMVTTFNRVQAAGETYITGIMQVTAKYRSDLALTLTDIQNALISYGSFTNQNINKDVNKSDIIALIDNLSRVEFLNLEVLASRPYARPVDHQTQLLWTRINKEGSVDRVEWRIEYTGLVFNIIKNLEFLGSVNIGDEFTDDENTLTFTINPGAYTLGETWTIVVYPYNENIELDDFTIPKVNISDWDIEVIPQLIPPIE